MRFPAPYEPAASELESDTIEVFRVDVVGEIMRVELMLTLLSTGVDSAGMMIVAAEVGFVELPKIVHWEDCEQPLSRQKAVGKYRNLRPVD